MTTTTQVPKPAKHRDKLGLGVACDSTPQLIDRINAGFPFSALKQFKQLTNFSMAEIADAMRMPVRTLSRRAREKRLTPTESERLLRLSRLFEAAVELFEGDREGARVWFRQPRKALGGSSPMDMAKTEVGAREVEDLIGRLEYGVFT